MKKILFLAAAIFLIGTELTFANYPCNTNFVTNPADSTRLAELDVFWGKLSQTVKEGDFEDYGALYHEDAVIVFAVGENKTSVPIAKALANWKKGFNDTKAGKQKDNVEFRFSQRIGDEMTAHETGIFYFTSADNDGKVKGEFYIHFEMLLKKGENGWLGLMEYQKSNASQEEWDVLK